MSLKKIVLALALASFTGLAWLGTAASPAVAASPAAQLTQLDKEIAMQSGQHSGKHGGKHHHKHGKHGKGKHSHKKSN